jgi:hypothetical protein
MCLARCLAVLGLGGERPKRPWLARNIGRPQPWLDINAGCGSSDLLQDGSGGLGKAVDRDTAGATDPDAQDRLSGVGRTEPGDDLNGDHQLAFLGGVRPYVEEGGHISRIAIGIRHGAPYISDRSPREVGLIRRVPSELTRHEESRFHLENATHTPLCLIQHIPKIITGYDARFAHRLDLIRHGREANSERGPRVGQIGHRTRTIAASLTSVRKHIRRRETCS